MMVNLLLTGSRALQFWGRLHNREPHDWDFIGSTKIIGAETSWEGTDLQIFDYVNNSKEQCLTSTPFGLVLISPLPVLKLLKLSCVDYLDKAKHSWDLKYLEDIELDDVLLSILEKRKLETKERVNKQKNEFFNKYDIVRYFDHDYLHTLIKEPPTYTKVLKDSVNICIDKFSNLSSEEKREMIREEVFVLALERYLIYNSKRNRICTRAYLNKFCNVKKSNDPALVWLSRISISGKLKDNPEFISEWATKNSEYMLDNFEQWWQEKVKMLPVSFWKELCTNTN